MSYNEKMNATTRFIIYICAWVYVLNNYLILLLGLIMIIVLIFIFNYNRVENFECEFGSLDEGKHTSKNPLYNVLNSDYG